MYYPLSAFLLLFANMIHNPEDPSVTADLQLMDLVISALAPMIDHNGTPIAEAGLQLFQELQNLAKKFLDSQTPQQAKKTKRGYDSDIPKESLASTPQPVAVVPQTQISQASDSMVSFFCIVHKPEGPTN